MAREGKISDFTGISAPYERPENPEITVNSSLDTVEESIEQIYEFMQRLNQRLM
jgi:adenylylsulfate kinase